MPGGRVDTIQRLFDAINAGGSEAVLAFFDPAVVWDMTAAQMPGVEDVYRGHDGLLRYLEWQELFGELQYESSSRTKPRTMSSCSRGSVGRAERAVPRSMLPSP